MRGIRHTWTVLVVTALAVVIAPDPAAADTTPFLAFGFGTAGQGDGQFREAGDIAIAPSGEIYVTDTVDQARVQVFDATGGYLAEFGEPGTGPGQFARPNGIVFDSEGHVLVLETNGARVQELEADGTPIASWGELGSGDGQLSGPNGLAIDGHDRLYVADTGNNRIQVFDHDGTHLDQWGTSGTGDGQFDLPRGVEIGPDGNVYVADTGNNRIQVFQPDGTYLSQWSTGNNVNGTGPWDLAFESDGDAVVLINDHELINFRPDRSVRWTIGTVGSSINHLAIGTDDRIYVSDFDSVDVYATRDLTVALSRTPASVTAGADVEYVLDLENTGNVTLDDLEVTGGPPPCLGPIDPLAAGEATQVECTYTTVPGDVGTLTFAATVAGEGVTVTSTSVSVAVAASPVVVTLEGTVPTPTLGETVDYRLGISNEGSTTLTGITVEDALAPDCEQPVADLAVGATATIDCTHVPDVFDLGEFGDLVNVARVFTDQAPPAVATGTVGFSRPLRPTLVRTWGAAGTDDGQFDEPTGVAVAPDGDTYVVDRGNDRVQRFDDEGTFVSTWGSSGDGDGQFDEPFGVVVGQDGDVYVVDSGNHRVQRFDPDGTFVDSFGGPGSGNGQFNSPADVDVLSTGNLVVTDALNSRVQELTPSGTFVRTWPAGFAATGIATGQGDDVYVTRSLEEDVRRFEPDGTGARALDPPPDDFDLPVAVDADPLGRAYVLNTGLGRVERFTPTDVQDLQFGEGQFDQPRGIAVDDGGRRVLVADTGNDRIVELAFDPTFDMTVALEADQTAVGIGDEIDFHLTITNGGNVARTGVSAGFGAECTVPVGNLAPFTSSTTDCTHVATVADADAGQFELQGFAVTDQGSQNGNSVAVDVNHRRRPDALVRLGNGAFVGGNRFNATGAQQARSATVANRGTARFTVQAQNDGTGTEDLRVRGQGGTNRFTVTYKRGAANVTNQVVAGTFRFADVPAGANRTLTVVVTARNGTPSRATLSRLVTVASDSTPTVKDVVKVTVTRR